MPVECRSADGARANPSRRMQPEKGKLVHSSPPDMTAPVRRLGSDRLRVLVVDDDRDNADSLALLAGIWGCENRTAYDGASALQVAAAYRPHVIILDLLMPMMSGI